MPIFAKRITEINTSSITMTQPEINNISRLFKRTKDIINTQREIEKLRGEKFNVFQILRLSSREDRLHSKFIAELLNPRGSHLKGNTFLKLFLEVVEHIDFDIKDTEVITEMPIGKVDHVNKTGGRIDICIKGKNNNFISIENKIYAGDQKNQIERYCTFNKNRNTTYYLTLHGTEPDKSSAEKLTCSFPGDTDEEGKKQKPDFYLISYEEHIIKWLEKCLKESHNEPILRESIRQYLILTKRLTKTMDDNSSKKLTELMLNNFNEARYIKNNYPKVLSNLRNNFRNRLLDILQEKLDKYEKVTFEAHNGGKIDAKGCYIWAKSKPTPKPRLKFGINNFNEHSPYFNGNLYIGLNKYNSSLNSEEKERLEKSENLRDSSLNIGQHWLKAIEIKHNNDDPVNLNDPEILRIISNKNSDEYKQLISEVADQAAKFITGTYEQSGELKGLFVDENVRS